MPYHCIFKNSESFSQIRDENLTTVPTKDSIAILDGEHYLIILVEHDFDDNNVILYVQELGRDGAAIRSVEGLLSQNK